MRKTRTSKREIKASPAGLAKLVSNGRWKSAPHLDFIDKLVAAALKSKNKHLIINMPPRHGKSELISVYLPIWFLCFNPDKNVILSCYGQSLATLFGRRVRDIIKEHGQNISGIEIDQSQKGSSHFGIKSHYGGFSATGVGGPITGKGADLFIIDDPIKNELDANSPNARDRLWEWFKSTAYTRLEPDGIFIIAMTRWHEDDICGRILSHNKIIAPSDVNITEIFSKTKKHTSIKKQIKSGCKSTSLFLTTEANNTGECSPDFPEKDAGKKANGLAILPNEEIQAPDCTSDTEEEDFVADEWVLIKLPAFAEQDDILSRCQDEPLWEERFNKKKLLQRRNTIGSHWFSAMYQQLPMPSESSIFNRRYFKYFDEYTDYYVLNDELEKRTLDKDNIRICSTADLAVKASQTSDYTVIITFAVSPKNDILVLDVLRVKFNASEHINLLENTRQRWSPQVIGIEGTQYQTALIQNALDKGFIVKELKADHDKISRSLPIAALMENGKVYFKKHAHWLTAFENELLSFPSGRYDDQVDAFAYIIQLLIASSGGKPVSTKRRGYLNGRLTAGYKLSD